MKFTLTLSKRFFPDKDERALYEKIGFRFIPSEYKMYERDQTHEPAIEIQDLHELIKFIAVYGPVVISSNNKIEICNNFI